MSPQIRRPRIRVIEEKSRNRQGVRHSKTFFPPLNSHPPSVPWRALFWLLSLSFVIASPVYSHPEKVKCGKLSQRSTFRTLDFSGGPGCYDWIADAER